VDEIYWHGQILSSDAKKVIRINKSSSLGYFEKKIVLKKRYFIGIMIMPGVTIGQGAVVGARACVFKDVEPWTIVGSNPAKFIKKRELNK
jgi:acetyltransferase-like isoleucine patch superfamily enzyme